MSATTPADSTPGDFTQAEPSSVEVLHASDSEHWVRGEQAIMGTRVQVELWHRDRPKGVVLVGRVMQRMRAVDQWLSPSIASSELARLNRLAGSQSVSVSEPFLALLQRSQQLSQRSQGAFDITFASLGQWYDYRRGRLPSTEQQRHLLSAINYRLIDLDIAERRISFRDSRVKIDLGGIAKGWAVDRAVELLLAEGIEHGIVTAGGDSRIIGDRRGRPWMVGVKSPRKEGAAVVLPIVSEAVSTSGDYERFFERDGVRHHHIINPQTGDSARSLHSVTVLGPEATVTDGLSTSIFVLGWPAGQALLDQYPDYEAVVIDAKENLHYSSGLQPASG